MHKLRRTCRLGRLGNHSSAVPVNRAKFLRAAFRQQSHQIDHDVSTGNSPLNRRLIPDISLHANDLAYISLCHQGRCFFGIAHGKSNLMPLCGQTAHQMVTNKAGTTKNRNQTCGHNR